MKNFEDLKNLILEIEADAVKVYEKGNVAAGKRLRKAMQEPNQYPNFDGKTVDVIEIKNKL